MTTLATNSPGQPKEFLSPAEAAAILDLRPKAVTELANQGVIRRVLTSSGRSRFNRLYIEALADEPPAFLKRAWVQKNRLVR